MAELITNGDFASGDTGWTLTGSASVISEEMRFVTTAGTIKQASIFETGATYTVSLAMSFGGAFLAGPINIFNGSSEDQTIGTIAVFSSADTYEYSFTATSSDGAIYITVANLGDGFSAILDNISVTQTSAAPSSGGGIRRRVRRTAIIDGKEIQVSSYEEAQRLFQHFKKTKKKPTKKTIRYKVYKPRGIVVKESNNVVKKPKLRIK